MRHFTFIRLALVLVLASTATPGLAQDGTPEPEPAKAVAVDVPTFPNANCPIMGKPASSALYAEVAEGRIYVCCAPCVKKVMKDPERAYKAAYPTVKPAGNTVCPVSGEAIPKDAPTVTVQGIAIAISTKEHATAVLAETQVALAKALDPKLVDVGNATCPVTGEAVAKNTFVVVDGALIRLSSKDAVDKAKTDPAGYLAKARQIAETAHRAAEAEKVKADAGGEKTSEPARSDK